MNFPLFRSLLLVGVCSTLHAEVQLNGVFGDGMVLQRNSPVPVWGTASAGEKVEVAFGSQKKSAVAGADGKWSLKLDPMPASTAPAVLKVKGTNEVSIQNVLVGEVWLCSGQSNMAYTMSALKNKPEYAGDLTSANFPLIRQGTVPREPSVDPVDTRKVTWAVCTPATVESFTAAGFYFARELQKETGVPVALILAAWGGTSAESWTSKTALETVPEFKARVETQIANLSQLPEQIKAFPKAIAAWEQKNARQEPPNMGEQEGWMNPGAADGWKPGQIKSKWSELGLPNGGVAWVRKEINVPANLAGKGFRIDVGQINEQYVTVYWNGKKIGEFGKKAPQFYKSYAFFDVPAAEVKEGANVLAMRFVSHLGDRPPLMRTFSGTALKQFGPIDDSCLVRVEAEFPPLDPAGLAARPKVPEGDAAHTSSALFGGMINPLIPFAIQGALWYQGEQDSSRGLAYRQLLPLMINDWRARWGRGDFAFIIQQLPNWKAGGANDTSWAEVREAQWMTANKLPNTAISVGIDIGESDDVHPSNKREAGRRLALVALEKVYGKKTASAGPVFESATKLPDGTFRLKFRSTGGLKTSDGKPPRQFAIAGDDRKFVDAEAKIEGGDIVVSAAAVVQPAAVRYAWINDPAGVNLTDGSGLPTQPFRTDVWSIKGEK